MGEPRPENQNKSELEQLALLTPRELEVYVLFAKSCKEIGCALGITERTARAHVSNILHKLNISSRIEKIGKNWPNGQ